MGKMPTNSLGKSSELKLHCFCLFDAYSMPKDMCSANVTEICLDIEEDFKFDRSEAWTGTEVRPDMLAQPEYNRWSTL